MGPGWKQATIFDIMELREGAERQDRNSRAHQEAMQAAKNAMSRALGGQELTPAQRALAENAAKFMAEGNPQARVGQDSRLRPGTGKFVMAKRKTDE